VTPTKPRIYANDQQQSLPRLAADLVARKPDLIYTPPTPAAMAAKQATDSIPIVFGAVWDPVNIGLVASLARPGCNVTGICGFAESLAPKRFELLREILPRAKRVGWIGEATDPGSQAEQRSIAPLAASRGLTIVFANAANPADVEAAMARLIAERVDVIFAGISPLLYNLRARLIELANQQRLPVIAYRAQFVDAGALFAFGPRCPTGCGARCSWPTRFSRVPSRQTFRSSRRRCSNWRST